uniref:Uncharacterized protein n=1 Tax=Kalanchoe fedtschenkoi TaxID=63787 RepID=A0A7N1A8Z2_KALFE
MAVEGGEDGREIRAGEETEESRAGFVEGCPGCKVDAWKASVALFPYRSFGFVWVVVLAASLPISSLFPFLYYMVRDFRVADKEEHIGYYAGVVGSAYMVGTWKSPGLHSVGRSGRPLQPEARHLRHDFSVSIQYEFTGLKVTCMNFHSCRVVFNTLFGFSAQFWMAVATRFLLGLLCGVLGPAKAYAMDICRKEHQALGMSAVRWILNLFKLFLLHLYAHT